jgi:hypothetical protein
MRAARNCLPLMIFDTGQLRSIADGKQIAMLPPDSFGQHFEVACGTGPTAHM